MDGFLSKPLRPADVWGEIDRVLKVSARRGHAPSLMDASLVLSVCGGDADALARISNAFAAQLPEQLTGTRTALLDGDPRRLKAAAHKLCGILGAVSTTAGAVASRLEDEAASGRLADVGSLVDELESIGLELIEELQTVTIQDLRHRARADADMG
jgi:HPt (histidine-containing phosphotransfer) domain-containing protein